MKPAVYGAALTIASAFIYGLTPVLTRITYDGGANGVTMTFLRAVLAMPVLAVLMRCLGIPFSITRREAWALLFACGVSTGATTLLLYVSYSYIPVGVSTTLHFIYPVLVSVGCVVFYREKLAFATLLALAAGTIGVFLTAGALPSGSAFGMLMALASGFPFAFYVVFVAKSEIGKMHFFKLSFYTCVSVGIITGIFSVFTGSLSLDLTRKAWLYAWIVSILISVGANAFLQRGIRLCGAAPAAILSTFEPATSVILGALVLGERLSVVKLMGSACVIASVIITAIVSSRGDGSARDG
jgi:drug/metabolite transporter (DMT)-like permease